MKKTLCIVLAFSCLLALFACAQPQETPKKSPADTPQETDPLSYDYDLTPYVTLGNYIGLAFDEEACQPTQEDLDDRKATDFGGKLVSRAAIEGDTVHIDYVGTLDGVAFDGGTAKDQALTLGSHTYISDFEEGLIGVTPGSTVDLDLSFPDPYPNNPDLAGKPVVFTVKLRYIEGPEDIVPELDDATVAALSPYESLKEYEAAITRVLYLERANSVLWQQIWASTEFRDLPQDAVEVYYNRTLDSLSAYASAYGYSIEDYVQSYSESQGITNEEFYADLRKDAEENVKYDLILHGIANKESIVPTDEDATDVLQQIFVYYAARYGFETLADVRVNTDEATLNKNELYFAVLRFARLHAEAAEQ